MAETLPLDSAPGPESIVKVTSLPGGGARTPPLPSFTFTCAVNVCVWPIGFVAVGGLIWMFASTNVLTASTEFAAGAVRRDVTVAPPIDSVAEACAVTLPAVGEVKVIVH